MAWSVLTWKILRIFQSQFLFGEVRAETRHSPYTKRCQQVEKNRMNRIIIGLILTISSINLTFGQNLQDGQIRWSADQKLTIENFKIKISDENNDVVFSQFMISHAIGGFDFMKRNLNQKIENIFLGNASWIDTTKVADI